MADLELIFDGALARLRFNAPARRNALNRATWRALPDACATVAARAEALVVVVEGAGGHFSAGADIGEFDAVYRDAAATRDYVEAMQAALAALASLDRPTIAAIDGSAIGGGLAVALCCDLRFAADDAHLAAPPAKLGLVYGPVETRRLIDLVGPARAKDLLFSGRRVAPAEALAIGLVDRVVAAADLGRSVAAYADTLAGLSQRSIRGAKRMIDAIAAGLPLDSPTLRAEVEAAALGEDFREARAALAEKRPPRFGPLVRARGVNRPSTAGSPRSARCRRRRAAKPTAARASPRTRPAAGSPPKGRAGRAGRRSAAGWRGRRPSAPRDRAPAASRRAGRAAAAGRAAGSAGNSGAARSRSGHASPGRGGNGCNGRRRPPARARW